MGRPHLTTLLAVWFLGAAARAEPPPLHFSCEALTEPSCEAVTREVTERYARAGRDVRAGASGFPHATVTAAERASVRVEVHVAGRPPLARNLDVAGEPSPAWTVALTVEQMVEREEAAALRETGRSGPEGPTGPQGPAEPTAAVWIGGEGGLAAPFPTDPGLAMRGGLVLGWTPARGPFFFRSRVYGELLSPGPLEWEAAGIAAGPGYRLVDHRNFGLTVFVEGFVRFVIARHEGIVRDEYAVGYGSGPEEGGGLWLAGLGPRWAVRPFLAVGLEFYRRSRQHYTVPDTGEPVYIKQKPALVAPALLLGAFWGPGG